MMAPEPLWSAACELTLSFLLGTFIFFIGLVQTEKEHYPKLQQLLHLKKYDCLFQKPNLILQSSLLKIDE